MNEDAKKVMENSFYYLLVVYTFLVLLISLDLFWKYSLQMSLFALVIAMIGIALLTRDRRDTERIDKRIHHIIFTLIIIFIILIRIIPYIENSIPLGYDAGLYKYGIEFGLKNMDKWIVQGGMEPGFLYLMEGFKLFFSTDFILKWLLIIFCALLGLGIYFVTKEYFGNTCALMSIGIYSISLIQFKTFWYMYYKNIVGLILALFSMYFLEKYRKNKRKIFIWLFVILGGLTGAIHRPSFYIFGLSYIFYAFVSPYRNNEYNINVLKKNIFYGIAILFIAGLFYLGRFKEAIIIMFEPVLEGFLQPGESPGTFINFFTFQYATLAYLVFGILGFSYLMKKKEFNMIFFWTLICAIIVYFQFFFFNRFIIHLDIALIILASAGFSIIIEDKRKFGITVLAVMLLSGGITAYKDSLDARPLISQSSLELIEQLQKTEKTSSIMAISSEYSPWVLAYSSRKTIAPGLFDENKWNEEEWREFWSKLDRDKTIELMSVYKKPIYLFAGTKNFNNLCFSVYLVNGGGKIYKYDC